MPSRGPEKTAVTYRWARNRGYTQMNFGWIPHDLFEMVVEYCKEEDLTRRQFLERALEELVSDDA